MSSLVVVGHRLMAEVDGMKKKTVSGEMR